MTPDSAAPPTPANSGGPPSERRQWPRNPAAEIRAALIPQPEPPPRFLAVLELSAGGIRLALDRPFGVGTVLDMSLHRPGRDFGCVVSATVVHVAEQLQGLFVTGCALRRPLGDDELRGLL